MEVTPEIYAWLTSLEIIDPFSSSKTEREFFIPEKTCKLMFNGIYFEIMLKNLQNHYNKFFNRNTNYIDNLSLLKPIENENDLNNDDKFYNWSILFDILNNFKLNLDKQNIDKLLTEDKTYLNELLTKIYDLTNKFARNENANENNEEKKGSEKINLRKLNPQKDYYECSSLLEFLIISLCKNFELDVRQSVALLSNNRKYLQFICNKGVKNDFTKVKNWLEDLNKNYDLTLKLLLKYPDGMNISYATIGSALYSKNYEIIEVCLNLLIKLKNDIGMNYDWFNKEGIDNFIFCIIKHQEKNIEIIGALNELIEDNLKEFFIGLRKKVILGGDDKLKVYEFLSTVLSCVRNIDQNFSNEIKNSIFEIILNEEEDLSFKISILGNTFLEYLQLNEIQINSIFQVFKIGLNSEKENVYSTTITTIFHILEIFGGIKHRHAPILYKFVVNIFMENNNFYNDFKREFILQNFENFFNNNPTIPIDILLSPYLERVSNEKIINLIDLYFIFRIVEHPRIEYDQFYVILKFILEIDSKNVDFHYVCNLILKLIFDKKLIQFKFNSEFEMNEICSLFINYINKTLNKFSEKKKKDNNNNYNYNLETSYDIVQEKFDLVNQKIFSLLEKTIIDYREKHKKNNIGLLAILWEFNEHDDVLLRLEENVYYKLNKNNKNKRTILNRNRSQKNKFEDKKIDKKFDKKTDNSLDNMTDININERKEFMEKEFSLENMNDLIDNQKYKKLSKKRLETKIKNLNSENNLILTEGTVINQSNFNKKISLDTSNILHKSYITSEVYKNFILPIDLEDEEDRESKAINGFNIQYKKELKDLFRSYMNEITNTITKSNFLKIFRDNNIDNHLFNLNELSITIRNSFGENLNELNYEQFIYLLIQISYLIFNKSKEVLSLSESYGNLLSMFYQKFNHKTEGTVKLNKRFDPIINYLKTKIKNKEEFNVPPGIKIKYVKQVNYNKKLNSNSLNWLDESKYICLEVLNEAVFDKLNMPILEPFVEIKTEPQIELDFTKTKKWSTNLTINFIDLSSEYEDEAIVVCDILEEGLQKICRTKNNNTNHKQNSDLLIEKEKNEKFKKRHLYLNKQMEKIKEEKKIEEKKKKAEAKKKKKLEREKQIQENQRLKEENDKRKEEIRKKNLEKEKKLKEEKKKNREKNKALKEERLKKKVEFFKEQEDKLVKQFKEIKEKREKYLKSQNSKKYLNQLNSITSDKSYMQSNKENLEFEKNLNKKIVELSEKENIKAVFDKYDNHLKLIYEIYSKMNRNKNSFEAPNALSINELRQFLINFTILGLLINTEQMNFIFTKLCKSENKTELNFKDFLTSFIYLTICSKFTNKNQRITQNEIDNFNESNLEQFIQFLGLRLPFNKFELENFINDRRAMTLKNLLELQRQIKKEKKIEDYKKGENKKEENENNENEVKNNENEKNDN